MDNPFKIVGVVGALGIVLAMLFSFWTVVDVGERGVVVGFGKVKETLSEGFHFVNPLYHVYTFNIRNNKYETTASSASADIQQAQISVAVNYNVDESKVADIYSTYGEDYINKIFTQNVQEAVKSSSAKYSASELITKREQVKADIKNSLIGKVADVIIVTDVSITNVDFSDSFDQAIENKVRADQEALEAEAKLRRSKLEAEAIRVQAEAIKSSGGQEYVMLKAIEKWNGVLPTTNTGQTIPFLNIK